MGEESDQLAASSARVHERQRLQLCAVHSLNNLLQLSEDTRTLPWTCGGAVIPRTDVQRQEANKTEFDQIADELCAAENELLTVRGNREADSTPAQPPHGDGTNTGTRSMLCVRTPGPSVYAKLTSSHRTMIFGNYSYEVLHVALSRRGVDLAWFTPDSMDQLLTAQEGHLVIGFIVNQAMEDDCWVSGSGILKRLPIVSWFFDAGRHWYSISRVALGAEPAVADQNEWRILDSDRGEIKSLSDVELFQQLKKLSGDDHAPVFRATIDLDSNREERS